jgi:hypothetical protein
MEAKKQVFDGLRQSRSAIALEPCVLETSYFSPVSTHVLAASL